LGKISDWNGFCRSIGDVSAYLGGNTAYNWTCTTPGGQHVYFSITATCQWQFQDTHALDRLYDYYDPNNGWQCWG
jgi:hypothetical protein